jgi:hypothetical protein
MIDHTITTETELYNELESIIGHTARKINTERLRAIFENALSQYDTAISKREKLELTI